MRIDHVALPAPNAAEAAEFVASVLGGLPVHRSGPAREFYQVDLPDGAFLLYTDGEVIAQHLALALERPDFMAAVGRLQELGIPHGNDPDAPTNGEWNDTHGTFGRVYFQDPAGHLLELVAR